MKPPLLSILTPSVWSRASQADALRRKIEAQITEMNLSGTVEHLVLIDNRCRSIGLKRQALADSARGRYIAFVDDDDDVSADYVSTLVTAIITGGGEDVITFEQECVYNGKPFHVTFQLGARDERLDTGGADHQRVTRGPWHVCAWQREKITHCRFLDCNYGEDFAWVSQARLVAKTSHHIPRVLHFYRHDARTTLAPEVRAAA